MDPGQEKPPLTNRGAALWGNFVITVASYPPRVIATNKDTGKVVWDTNMADGQVDVQLTAAPLAVKDKIIVGASGGDRGVRDWIAGLDAATGKIAWRKYTIPAPGEPGSETWKDKNNAWKTGGGAMWVTGSYDPATNQVLWGTGNPVPWSDPYYRPGDNLYTNSLISWDPDSGKMNWYYQYTPGDMWDYDEEGSHILIDGSVAGQPRKLVTHAARNGFLYSLERANGQTVLAKPYVSKITWTKGIDQKTGKPVDYDPNKDVQNYSGGQTFTVANPTQKLCPSMGGGNNYFPPTYSKKTGLLYIPSSSMCNEVTMDQGIHQEGRLFQSDVQERRARGIGYRDGRSADRRGQEARAHALSEHERSGFDGRRTRVHGVRRRNDGRLRRHDHGAGVEDQCRYRLQRAADDLRGWRQAIRRHPVRHQPHHDDAQRHRAGTARPAQPDHAVRLRAVSLQR